MNDEPYDWNSVRWDATDDDYDHAPSRTGCFLLTVYLLAVLGGTLLFCVKVSN